MTVPRCSRCGSRWHTDCTDPVPEGLDLSMLAALAATLKDIAGRLVRPLIFLSGPAALAWLFFKYYAQVQ